MSRFRTASGLLIAVALATDCAGEEPTRPITRFGPSAQVEEASGAPSVPLLVVNSPANIAGSYAVGTASFGPPLTPGGVTGDVILALDAGNAAGPSMADACTPLTNTAGIVGRIALVDRGTCAFVVKVKNAQNSGAIAVIVVDNEPGPPGGMGGADPTIAIPSVRISQADGNLIKNALSNGVNATLLVATAEQAIPGVIAQLAAIIDANPGSADKLEDALAKVATALSELNKTPADRQAALGNLEGAVGDLEAAVKDNLTTVDQGEDLMFQLLAAARVLAETAIQEAIDAGGTPGMIDEAEEKLTEGDALRDQGKFKDAAARYKDALAKAEGA